MKRLLIMLQVLLLLMAPAAYAQTGAPERIRFQTGATSAQVTGQVSGGQSNSYVLYAAAGQIMQLIVNSGTLTVVSPSGEPLVRGTATAQPVQFFSQTLTESGDYQIQVSAPAGAGSVTYTMNVTITGEPDRSTSAERIRFQPGTTGTQVTGQISGAAEDSYVFHAFAGQTIQVDVDNAYLSLVSPTGQPLARAQSGAQNVNLVLPESGDYSLRVALPVGSASVTYTMNVSITGSAGDITASERIRFARGATSTQLARRIAVDNEVDSYVLEAFIGQTMQVTVDNAYLTVVSPSGEPLARAQTGAQNVNRVLPESGDYIVQVSVPAGFAPVSYTLTVTITGEPDRSTSTERIRFQPGTSSTQVVGQLVGGAENSYLLHVLAGQTMSLTVDNGTLTVVSPSGEPLVRGTVTAQPVRSFSRTLTETGDYQVSVSAPADAGVVNYVLNVSIPR